MHSGANASILKLMIIKAINKINLKKFFLIFLLGVFVFGGIFAAQVSMAEEGKVESPGPTDTVASTQTQIGQVKELGGLGGVVVWIGSKILLFAAAGVDFAIALGDGLIGIKAVQIGWNIVLQFTNLGFVLAIIVIAFATILRMESYGMKKILWKLVVAALLVNFSLVIAGAFISMSSTLSDVFIGQALGNNGTNLSIALGNAIQPQKLGQVQERDAGFWEKLTNTLNYFFEYLAGLFFVIVFTFLAALAFLTLFIMLLVRIIALMILLIVAPIVWLLWIFPATNKYWKQWWTEFLRWNFFAPVVLFFVYLAVATAAAFQTNDVALKDPAFEAALTKSQTQYSAAASVNKTILNPKLDSVSSGNSEEGFFGYAAQLLVVLGMLYGGIYVANKFSIYGGNLGVDIAQSTGKGAGAWMGRKTKQYSTAPLRAKLWKDEQGKRTQSMGEKLVGWGKNRPTLAKWTGFGLLAKGITRLETTGGENILKQHEKAVGGLSINDLKAANLTASGPRRIAVMKELAKRKSLGDVNAKELITKENKALFERYQQGVVWGDVEHGAKMNVEIAKELRDTGKASLESVQKFVRTYKGKDIEQSVIKDLYSGKAKLGLAKEDIGELGSVFAEAFAKENYQMVPKIVPTMNAQERNNFSKAYEGVIGGAWDDPELGKKVVGAWQNTMSNYAMGFSAESAAGASPSAALPA